MELVGAKRCFAYLEQSNIKVAKFVSNRHIGIAKWVRETLTSVQHYYDIWHIARSITKKLIKGSKEKDCEVISEWVASIKNHLYWCATSTTEGFNEMIKAKWKSFMRHVQDLHDDHPDELFKECIHEELQRKRQWIKNGKFNIDCSVAVRV